MEALFISKKKNVLNQLQVWKKMTILEKEDFLKSKNEFEADRKKRTLIFKYL